MTVPDHDLWLFAYGSLMWRPGFAFEEAQRARLTGYRRCFSIYSVHHRGTPERLELEITETVLLQDSEATLATLHQLRELGVRIAMDDFGTGYSSLSYLQRFPFDKIKIDRSFVKDITIANSSLNIVRAVAALANGLGIATTAEGVETQEQLDTVKSEGCTEMQGFLFSKPVPSRQIDHLIDSRHRERKTATAMDAA